MTVPATQAAEGAFLRSMITAGASSGFGGSGSLSSFNALCIAASIGGDTDTIAAILGAMLGACLGMQCWPEALVEQVKRVNGLDLQPLAQGLLALR